MKYVQINAYADAWADNIIFKRHRRLLEEGNQSYVFWGRSGGEEKEDNRCRRFNTNFDVYFDALQTRIDGKPGFHSKRPTKKLIQELDRIDPDVVHLHVLCGYYLNIELLFNWLSSHRCKVIWTLHDCWPFTGRCIFFTAAKCNQWKYCCGKNSKCLQPEAYPETFKRNMEQWNYLEKKRIFTSLPQERVKITVPSQWLANLVSQSFLSDYSIEVIGNEIDNNIFKPTLSNYKERLGIANRFMVLGVASKWSERKGLNLFVELAQLLDANRFTIVLVGLSNEQINKYKNIIVGLPKTKTLRELAMIYSSADVFVHPGVEETFGMTVAEALACGTHVVVSKGTACAEIAEKRDSSIVPANDIQAFASAIRELEKNRYGV